MSQPEAKLMVRQAIIRRNEILKTFVNDLFENLAHRAQLTDGAVVRRVGVILARSMNGNYGSMLPYVWKVK
jgi:hypothetical protein